MPLRLIACGLVAGLAAAAGGCGAEPLEVWAAGDMLRLSESTPADAAEAGGTWDPETGAVTLRAAANETAAFQLVLDAPRGPAGGVTVEIDPPVGPDGPLPPGSVRLYRQRPMEVGRLPTWHLLMTAGPIDPPERFYDALVPINTPAERPSLLGPPPGRPRLTRFDLPRGGRAALWVDVHIPRDATPGRYRAPIRVRAGGRIQRGTLRLEVLDLVLPDQQPVLCLGAFGHEEIYRHLVGGDRRRGPGRGGRGGEPVVPVRLDVHDPLVREGLIHLRGLMRLARRHRVDLFDRSLRPRITRDEDGRAVLAWEDYDAIARPYLEGTAFGDRIGVAAWPAPLHAGWPRPLDYGGPDAEVYRETIRAVWAQTINHFVSLGQGGRLFFWPRAHPGSVAPAVLLGPEPGAPVLMAAAPGEAGGVPGEHMYAPPADALELTPRPSRPATRPAIPTEPDLSGLYLRPGPPPFAPPAGPLAKPADLRALAWLAMRHGCRGIFLPETLGWDAAGDAGPGRLFHAVDGRIVPSVRLKWLRRGLQDAAYLRLLRRRDRGAVADLLLATMVTYAGREAGGEAGLDWRLAGWVRDGATWSLAGRVLAGDVRAAVRPGEVTRRQARVQQVLWSQLRERTGRVVVERIRHRLERVGAGVRVELRVILRNRLASAALVRLEPGDLPPGWQAEGLAEPVTIPPGRAATATLRLVGPGMPLGPGGKTALPLEVAIEGRPPVAAVARVPALVSRELARPVVIDGRLDEWPARAESTAGRFIVLGRRGLVGDGLARRQTVAFVQHDERNLYIAFRCEEPNPAAARARPSNVIDYEAMVPRSEDLVEVVLDPARGADGPDGLFRLTVKPNGVLVGGRGVPGRSPGGRGPWPAGTKAAAGRAEGAWTVELAVPRAALGSGGAEELWNLNLIRHTPTGRESSSWTGAVGGLYHPGSLGTLYLKPADAGP
jgi:hypothetical protein